MSIWKSHSFIRTGSRHLLVSVPCQDFVMVDENIGAAISDGVSRSISPEKASQYATKTALEVCRKASQNPLWMQDILSGGEDFKRASDSLSEEICRRVKEKLKEYPKAEATLSFVYMLNERYAVVGYIGDSAAIVISDGEAEVFTQTRDYGGATESIAHPKAAQLMDIQLIDIKSKNVKAFVLTTDGLEHELYIKGKSPRVLKACENYVNACFEPDSQDLIENLLDKVTENELFDDDISLAILARDKITLPHDPTWLCTCQSRTKLPNTYCTNCGADYFTLYRNADTTGFSSVWEYFIYLNNHPEEELRVIGMKPQHHKDKYNLNVYDEDNSSAYDDTSAICIHDSVYHKPCHHKNADNKKNPPHIRSSSEPYNEAKVKPPKETSFDKGKYLPLSSSHKKPSPTFCLAVVLLYLSIILSVVQIISLSCKINELESEIQKLKATAVSYAPELPKNSATPDEGEGFNSLTTASVYTTSVLEEAYPDFL